MICSYYTSPSVLARNRTWSSTFAGSRANPAHPEDNLYCSTPPRSRTPSCGSEDRRARHHTRRANYFSIPTWTRTRAWTFGGSNAIHYTIGTNIIQYPDQESNLDNDLRRIVCVPLHHRDVWGRRLDSHQHEPVYKTGAFLSRATSAQARARGVEPRASVLEADCSPRSTLV